MSKRTIVFSLLLSAFLLLTASCGGGSTPATGTLGLHNSSSVPIDNFYLSPTTQSLWGPNQLASSLDSGFYTEFVVLPDTYDAKATTIGFDSTYYAYLYDFTITAGNTFDLFAFDSNFTGSMEVTNDTVGAVIIELYIVPSGSTTWGPNQITTSIGPAGFFHLTDMPADSYDVKVVWDVGPDSDYFNNSVNSLTLTTLPVS